MYKPAYAAFGVLAATLSQSARAMQVDAGLRSYLVGILDPGDWAYVQIQDDNNTEIVKVIKPIGTNLLELRRGIDSTYSFTFLVGAKVSYTDTVAAFKDQESIPVLELTQDLAIQINYPSVKYPEASIECLGSAEFIGNILDIKKQPFGCCSLLPNNPPPIE